MPFGLANGPSHFQRAMDYVFRDLLGKCVMVYIDDIVIFSKNLDEHIEHLQLVLSRLAEYGLQIKPEKCKFAKSEIKLLGYILNEKGIKANPEKTAAIAKMPPPQNSQTGTILFRDGRVLQAMYPELCRLSSTSN